jgi:hypothetical protein
MANQTRDATHKLLAFVALVVAAELVVFVVNRSINLEESALSASGNAKLRTARATPTTCQAPSSVTT